jgi:hypothetical protein
MTTLTQNELRESVLAAMKSGVAVMMGLNGVRSARVHLATVSAQRLHMRRRGKEFITVEIPPASGTAVS